MEQTEKQSNEKDGEKDKVEVVPASADPPQNHVDSLLDQYQKDCFIEAVTLARAMTTNFPKFTLGWKFLHSRLSLLSMRGIYHLIKC